MWEISLQKGWQGILQIVVRHTAFVICQFDRICQNFHRGGVVSSQSWHYCGTEMSVTDDCTAWRYHRIYDWNSLEKDIWSTCTSKEVNLPLSGSRFRLLDNSWGGPPGVGTGAAAPFWVGIPRIPLTEKEPFWASKASIGVGVCGRPGLPLGELGLCLCFSAALFLTILKCTR
jgi:hypothetical protein